MFVADEKRERFSAGLKQLKANATATLRVFRDLEVPPKVNAFRINKMTFQDYFDPEEEADLGDLGYSGYSYFSRASQPFTDGGPQIEYRRVIEKRFRQYLLLSELKPADRSPNLPRLPTPPILHSDLSWQSWVRRMWHEPALVRDPIAGTIKKLEEITGVISRYFISLTQPTRVDVEEGPRVRSYLERTFPRAVTGGLVHDCYVYALRWIYMLGQLLDTRTLPSALSNPRSWLIEMPAHAGVMIRLEVVTVLKKKPTEEILIAINNDTAVISSVGVADTVENTAETVVTGMYEGPPTPMLITSITGRATDARSLWRQFPRRVAKKVRNATLTAALTELVAADRVHKDAAGYAISR